MKLRSFFHRGVWVLMGGVAGFAGGWFLRPQPEVVSADSPPLLSLLAAKSTAPTANDAIAKAWSDAGGKDGQPRPFTSLQEIVEIANDIVALGDDLGAVSGMEALPRLMATDAATARTLLAALEQAEGLDDRGKKVAANALYVRWLGQDPGGAAAYGLAHPETFDDSIRALSLSLLARRDPAKAQAAVQALPEEARERANEHLAEAEMLRDPGKYLASAPWEKLENAAEALQLWALKDPRAAADWATGQQGEHAASLARKVAEVWATKDKSSALAWAAGLKDGERQQAEYAIAASLIGKREYDPATVEEGLSGIPRRAMLMAALDQRDHFPKDFFDKVSSAELQELLTSNADPVSRFSRLMSFEGTAELAAKLGPAATAQWIASLPDGEISSAAIGEVSRQWARQDPEAASAWVSSLPEDRRTSAANGLISAIKQDDPEGALAWVKVLPDPTSRATTARGIYENWLQRDPVAAIAALSQTPPEEQERIFQRKENR